MKTKMLVLIALSLASCMGQKKYNAMKVGMETEVTCLRDDLRSANAEIEINKVKIILITIVVLSWLLLLWLLAGEVW